MKGAIFGKPNSMHSTFPQAKIAYNTSAKTILRRA
jgi:hypothetical protein